MVLTTTFLRAIFRKTSENNDCFIAQQEDACSFSLEFLRAFHFDVGWTTIPLSCMRLFTVYKTRLLRKHDVDEGNNNLE
jgi:hypothetical protein